MQHILIIGGGLGGLFAGAILTKEGLEVTVLEKNATAGGGLQSFTRFGEVFDTGMHVAGGLQEGASIRRLCQWLGIWDKMQVEPMPAECIDRLYFAEDRRYYQIASGRAQFVDSLSADFPHQRQHIERYVEAMYSIVDEMDLFHLRPASRTLFSHSEEFNMAADAFIAKYITDPRLRQVAAYLNPLYGGQADMTPAYIHATISVLHLGGLYRFAGGTQQFAETLCDSIRAHGGTVVTGDPVQHIHTEGRGITGVTTRKGRHYSADRYVSAIHPCALLPLFDDPKALPRAYRMRLQQIPSTHSAFLLYLKLKPETFPYLPYSGYYISRYDGVWSAANPFGDAAFYMTPPMPDQGAYSQKMIIAAPMLWHEVSQWADTTLGHRPADYSLWKDTCAETILSKMEEMYPGFRSCVSDINTASPLTIRDYYGTKDGALFGYAKDWRNTALSLVPVVTKIPNLLLTGQCAGLHGFCGVPLTAITTCEALLGPDSITRQLSLC